MSAVQSGATAISNDKSPFHYRPLPNKEDIRLLTLEPGPWEAALRGTVRVVPHSDISSGKVEYEAISYAWGDATDQRVFSCDGGDITIPSNLYHALLYLRKPDAPRTLWADSTCISQNDPHEKAIQVHQRMFAIFHEATRVILWLGAPERGSDLSDGLRALKLFFKMVGAGRGSEEWGKLTEMMEQARRRSNVFELDPKLMACKEPDWSAMTRILDVRYFDRLWILQETISARNAIMKYGDEELDWELARRAGKFIMTKFYDLKNIPSAVTPQQDNNRHTLSLVLMTAGSSGNGLFRAETEGSTNLFSILMMTNHMNCYDPRDALFAVIHLISDLDLNSERASLLRPDYEATPSEIFRRLAVWLIVEDRQYDYLVFSRAYLGKFPQSYFDVVDTDKRDNSEILLKQSTAPSWVPMRLTRSSSEYYMHSIGKHAVVRRVRPGRAGGEHKSGEQQPSISDDGRVLGMLGRMVTDLTTVSTRQTQEFLDGEITTPTYSAMSKAFLEDNVLAYVRSALTQLYGRDRWEAKLISTDLVRLVVYMMVSKASTNPSIPRPASIRNSALASPTELYMQYIRKFARPETHPEKTGETLEEPWPRTFDAISKRILNFMSKRRLCVTADDKIGVVPWHSQAGDLVCVFNQVCVPMLLRPKDDGTYLVVGECYIDSLMNGEALARSDLELRRVLLS